MNRPDNALERNLPCSSQRRLHHQDGCHRRPDRLTKSAGAGGHHRNNQRQRRAPHAESRGALRRCRGVQTLAGPFLDPDQMTHHRTHGRSSVVKPCSACHVVTLHGARIVDQHVWQARCHAPAHRKNPVHKAWIDCCVAGHQRCVLNNLSIGSSPFVKSARSRRCDAFGRDPRGSRSAASTLLCHPDRSSSAAPWSESVRLFEISGANYEEQ
jgi:hypothetical protein